MRLGRWRLGAALLALALLVLAPSLVRFWRSAKFLSALSRPTLAVSRPGDRALGERRVVEEDMVLRGTLGPLRARLYGPDRGANGRGVVVAHGVHHRGIDERRLVAFVRELARTGLWVLTPELSDLADYRITSQGISVIRDSVRFLSADRDRVKTARVGLLGFSFAGGLSLVAASQSETAQRLAFVGSVGGHHDLSRVLRFLTHHRVETPLGPRKLKAHDYGLLVLTYGYLEHFVPEADLPIMRQALRAWLEEKRAKARAVASERTTLRAERLWLLVETENLGALAPEIEAIVTQEREELAALSPRGRLSSIGVPVYLLHGSADTVIPPSELAWADIELSASEHAALVSPLLDHIEVSRKATLGDRVALVRFMARIL